MLIFDENSICTCAFCREVNGERSCSLAESAFTIVLVSSGLVSISAADSSAVLSAGEFFLCSGTIVQLAPDADCHILAAGFDGTAAQTAGAGLLQPLVGDCKVCPMTASLLAELYSNIENGGSAGLSALCYHILCETANADSSAPRLSPLVSEAVLAIRQNYAGLYGVEELSAQLGVSKSHLVRIFSAEMGVGPGQYLTSVRIDAAKALLTRRDYPLEVVATLSGFSGANYLCKVFKKNTGLTPSEYRSQHAGSMRGGVVNEMEAALYT